MVRSPERLQNSLFAPKNSLLGLQKFPVPLRREFSLKSFEFAPLTGPQNRCREPESAKFPVNFPVNREFGVGRLVRSGLHPPPRSPMRTNVSRSLTNSPQFAGISAGSNAGRAVSVAN